MAVREYARPAADAVSARGHRVELLKAPSWRGVPVGLDDYGYRIAEEIDRKGVDVDLLIGLSVGTQVVAAAAHPHLAGEERDADQSHVRPADPIGARHHVAWFERGEGDDQSDWGRQLRDWTHTDPVRIGLALRSGLRSSIEDVLPHVARRLTVGARRARPDEPPRVGGVARRRERRPVPLPARRQALVAGGGRRDLRRLRRGRHGSPVLTTAGSASARERIGERRREITARLADVERRLDDVRAARADWTDEEHDPEGFALTFEWQQAEGVRTEYLAELTALDAAEARVDAGTYGVCEICGEPIPDAQLALRPARTACVACADKAVRR